MKLALLPSLLVLGALGLAACESDDETNAATGTGTATVTLEADPDGVLAYVQDTLEAPAGAVTIQFHNPSGLGHDVVVEDSDGNEITGTDVISDGSATAAGEFEPGEYAYYCSVPGHRYGVAGPQAENPGPGMKGTLTVR